MNVRVKINFPYANIITNSMPESEARGLISDIMHGRKSSVKVDNREYFPNREMITYCEMEPSG